MLTDQQRGYIKKNFRFKSAEQIADTLGISINEVLGYLEKKIGKTRIAEIAENLKNDRPTTKNPGFLNIRMFLKQNVWSLLFLTFLVIATYANSLTNEFLSDDIPTIVQNEANLKQFSYIFNPPVFPIRPLFYSISYHIAGLNPTAFRFWNILFHLGSVLLLYALITHLYNKRVALFAAGLMAVHSLLVEPVVWISGGAYVLGTFLFLLSFLTYVIPNRVKYYLISLVSFFFALSATAPTFGLPIILLLYEFLFGNLKKNWLRIVPYAFLAATFVLVSIAYIPQRSETLRTVNYLTAGVQNPAVLIPVAISNYLNLLAWPKELTLYHSELSFTSIQYVIQLVVTLLFLGLVAWTFFKSKKAFLWLSLFLVGLAPLLASSILSMTWVVAERYVYLSTIGIFVALALLLDYLSRKNLKHVVTVIFLILISALSVRSIIRNIDWKNQDNLWVATGKTSPSSPNTHNNLGDMYGRHGDKEVAIKEFQKAIELKPNYADAYHNLANTYRETNQIDLALVNYQKAIDYNPNLWQSYQNMAAIYFNRRQYEKALENMQKAVQIQPQNLQLENNLALVYLALGQVDKAKPIFQQVLQLDPQNQFAQKGLAEVNKEASPSAIPAEK